MLARHLQTVCQLLQRPASPACRQSIVLLPPHSVVQFIPLPLHGNPKSQGMYMQLRRRTHH